MTRIVNFGVSYSPNLGDGMIAECIAYAVGARSPGSTVVAVDLAGRTRYGAQTVRYRSAVLKALHRTPKAVRTRLVQRVINRGLATVSPSWTAMLANADLVVVGGGQIFSDADLNFPLKIGKAVELAGRANLPLAVYAVGVSMNWSPTAVKLFAGLNSVDLRFVGVRDQDSMAAWTAQMPSPSGSTAGSVPHPVLTRDPGLLAVECYGPATMGDWIGLGVTASEALHHHASGPVAGASVGGGVEGYLERLTVALAERGQLVQLFCNGAHEDRRALQRIADKPVIAKLREYGRVSVAAPPETPAELVQVIASCKALAAYRLHACIAAYSYSRPCIGLAWDKKLDSFLASVGHEAWAVHGSNASVDRTCAVIEQAIASGVNAESHTQHLAEAWGGIDSLLAGLGGARAARESAGADNPKVKSLDRIELGTKSLARGEEGVA